MQNEKKTRVIGFLGTNLDSAQGVGRWEKWRPTVDMCSREDFLVDRYELLYEEGFAELATQVMEDIRQVSPETEVIGRVLGIQKAWDFEDVFARLYDYSRAQDYDASAWNTFVHITTGTHVAQICLFLLTESRHFPGKLIQTSPPRGRGQGRGSRTGLGGLTVIDLDLSRYDKLASRFDEEKEEARDFLKSGIATRNDAFNQLIGEIEVVALRSRAPMLLTGPTGAGKSRLAQRIYELRQQRCGVEGAFVEVNCATLRGDTAMSALFGHKKGAFTGAQTDRPGLLREAQGGVLFLDEIGELGADEQAVLLRAVEEGVYLPVGADRPMKSKFQLIVGTNRDLRQEVVEGSFREDLLARINTWTFELPGLDKRKEDIEPNLDFELEKFALESGRQVTLNKEARDKFLQFAMSREASWRGNFRDLNAAVTRMGTLAPHGRIRLAEVQSEQERLSAAWHREELDESDGFLRALMGKERYAELDPFDRVQLAYVVEVCRGAKTVSEAGRRLFAVSRVGKKSSNDSDRLRKYLAKFDLDFADMS